MSVLVTAIKDPFEPYINDKKIIEYVSGKSIEYYINHIDTDSPDIHFNLFLNSTCIPQDQWDIVIVQDGDRISICAKLEAAAIASAFTSFLFGGSAVSASVYGAYLAVYTTAYLVTTFAIGYGASKLLTLLGPDVPTLSTDTNSTNTYGWDAPTQTAREGISIPYIFGTVRISGNVLNQFFTIDGNEETVNILLAICDHRIDSVTDIRINNQPSTYFRGIETGFRLGTNNDASIPGFSEITTQAQVNTLLLENISRIQTTGGDQVEKIVIAITAPNGLYFINELGEYEHRSAEFRIEYRVSGTTVWTLFDTVNESDNVTTSLIFTYPIDNLTPNRYDVRITRINAPVNNPRGRSDIYFSYMQEIIKEDLIYPGLGKYYVKALATEQLSGGSFSISCLASRNTVSVFNEDTQVFENRRATSPAWIVYALLVEFAEIPKERIIWDDFIEWSNYCDEQVDGDFRFIVNAEISDGNFWGQANKIARMGRATIIRRGSRYGIFADMPDDLVTDLFNSGNTIDGSFSIQYLPSQDRANAVEIEYSDVDRDYTRQVVTVYSANYLENDEVPQKTNIIIEAATTQAQAVREAIFRINSTQFLNRVITFDAFYDSFAVTVGDIIYFQHEIPDYDLSISGRLLAAGNDYGGVSNVPYVEIDMPYSLPQGQIVSILIRLQDNTFVEKRVTSAIVPGYTSAWQDYDAVWGGRYTSPWATGQAETTVFVLDSNFATVPIITIGQDQPIYNLGISTLNKKRYRVTSCSRKDDFIRTIVAAEYVPEIYTFNDGFVIPEQQFDTIPQEAVNVIVDEVLVYDKTGSYASSVSVSWYKAVSNLGTTWNIWSENLTDGSSPVLIGTSFKTSFLASNDFILGNQYRIYVSTSETGPTILDSNTDTLTILGKLAPPSDVANFNGVWDSIRRIVRFNWSPVSDIDLLRYEIRQGSSFDAGTVVSRTDAIFSTIRIAEGVNETITYHIKAVDTSKIFSQNADSVAVAIDTSETTLVVPTGLQLTTASEIAFDGTNVVSIVATWSNNAEASPDWSSYDLLLENVPAGSVSAYSTSDTQYRWEVVPNTLYGVSVRAVDVSGNRTQYSTQERITSTRDETAPSDPTNLVADGTFTQILLTWNHGGEPDLSHFLIFRNTVDDSTTATQVGSAIKEFSGSLATHLDTPPTNDSYFYWIKAVDSSNNISGFSNSDSADSPGIGILPGSITETEIADNAISTPKLRANAVVAAKIAAGQIGTDHLVAGAVTADKMTVTQLSAIVANLGTITSGRIQNSTNTSYFDLTNNTFALGNQLTYDGVNLNFANGVINAAALNVSNLAAISSNLGTITAGNISAALITSGTLNANRIGVNTITANKLNIPTLSSISANIGTITAGNISATLITSGTLDVNRINANSIQAGKLNLSTWRTRELTPTIFVGSFSQGIGLGVWETMKTVTTGPGENKLRGALESGNFPFTSSNWRLRFRLILGESVQNPPSGDIVSTVTVYQGPINDTLEQTLFPFTHSFTVQENTQYTIQYDTNIRVTNPISGSVYRQAIAENYQP